MSVFSMIKRGRQAAKEHADKQMEKEKEKEKTRTEYHHVPTHAASDALLGAPSGWKKEDAKKIREHNRKRNALNAAGTSSRPNSSLSMLSPYYSADMSRSRSSRSFASSSRGPNQFPRVNSSLSQVSYPVKGADAAVRTSRSFNSLDAEMARGYIATSPQSKAPTLPAPPGPSSIDWATAPLPPLPTTSTSASRDVKGKDASLQAGGDALEMRTLTKQPRSLSSASGTDGNSYYPRPYPSPTLGSQSQMKLKEPAPSATAIGLPPVQPTDSSVSRTSSSHTLVSSDVVPSHKSSPSSTSTITELAENSPQLKPKNSMHMMSLMPGGFPSEILVAPDQRGIPPVQKERWPIQSSTAVTV